MNFKELYIKIINIKKLTFGIVSSMNFINVKKFPDDA